MVKAEGVRAEGRVGWRAGLEGGTLEEIGRLEEGGRNEAVG